MQRVGYVKRLCAMGVFVDSRNSRRTEIATGSSTNRGTYHRARRAVALAPGIPDPTTSTWSILSAVNTVNLVNTVQ